MLKRKPALGILLVIVCVISLALFVRAQSSQSTKNSAAASKNQSAQHLLEKQTEAAKSQANAAWVQAGIILVQAGITGFLYWLTWKQVTENKLNRDEMVKDREEVIKGRKLSQMPVLSCDVQYVPDNTVKLISQGITAPQRTIPATLTLQFGNSGNAPALKLKPKIAAIRSGPFNYTEVPITLSSFSLAPGSKIEHPKVAVPVANAFGDFATTGHFYFHVSVEFVNVYKQKFITEAVFQEAQDLNGINQWNKLGEGFFILGWEHKYDTEGGEPWARQQVQQILKP